MTISSPTFQRLQTGITSADDLRVRGPINAALAWLSGDLVTQLNTHFDAVSQSVSAFIANRASFSAHKNGTDQGSISATPTPVSFGTEEFDTGSFFASSAWTPPAGKACLTACIQFTASNAVDGEQLILSLFKNGAVHKRIFEARSATSGNGISATWVVDTNGTDSWAIYATKGGAGVGEIEGDSFASYFMGHMV